MTFDSRTPLLRSLAACSLLTWVSSSSPCIAQIDPKTFTPPPGARFPEKVWTDVCDAVSSLFQLRDLKTDEVILAPDGLPEPFIQISRHACAEYPRGYFGLFSNRFAYQLLDSRTRDPFASPQIARLRNSGRLVSPRPWVPPHPSGLLTVPPMQASLAQEAPLRLNCDPTSRDREPLSLALMGFKRDTSTPLWRVVYAAKDNILGVRGWYADDLRITSQAMLVGDVGDGTQLVNFPFRDFGKSVNFRIDARTGLPIGRIPTWLKVISFEEVAEFAAAFRKQRGRAFPDGCGYADVEEAQRYEQLVIDRFLAGPGYDRLAGQRIKRRE